MQILIVLQCYSNTKMRNVFDVWLLVSADFSHEKQKYQNRIVRCVCINSPIVKTELSTNVPFKIFCVWIYRLNIAAATELASAFVARISYTRSCSYTRSVCLQSVDGNIQLLNVGFVVVALIFSLALQYFFSTFALLLLLLAVCMNFISNRQ